MRKGSLTAVALFSMLVAVDGREATAATDTARMRVVASVNSACSVGTSDLDFNTYDSLVVNRTAPLDVQTTISIVCSAGRIVRVRLGQGDNPEAGSTDADPLRQMTSGSDFLRYNLYVDAARTQVWTNAPPGERPASALFPAIMTIYGRIPEAQTPSAGLYADSVVATVTF